VGLSWRRRNTAPEKGFTPFSRSPVTIETSAQAFFGGKFTTKVTKKLPSNKQVALWHATPELQQRGEAKKDAKGAEKSDKQVVYLWLEHGPVVSDACFLSIAVPTNTDLAKELEVIHMHVENADTGQALATFAWTPTVKEKERNNAAVLCRIHKHAGQIGHWQFTAMGATLMTKSDLDTGVRIQENGIAVCPPCEQPVGGKMPPESQVYDDVPLPQAYIRPVQLHASPEILVASDAGTGSAKAIFEEGKEGNAARAAVAKGEPLAPETAEHRSVGGGVYAEPSEVDPCDLGKLGDFDIVFKQGDSSYGTGTKNSGDATATTHDDQPRAIGGGGNCCCCCDDDC